MNFQEMILALQQFWVAQGCVFWNPYNMQVGAGTNNPATLLRVLGPEPWRVAYVEPSIRPDDGRYGENPNRMQRFLQYQVILKPEPGNPQELYLASLAALGIEARDNDIRFVEDNWQSPPLGAWGLGWEVWLNGQEIAQFTYFQQAAGIPCDPVSVEITYGLERMAMALQGVDSVWDIAWQGALTYGDVFRDEERAHSQYYFEIADVAGLRTVYDTYQREHERALAAGAILPAYDYVLKCNHIFNVLDTRGAIGVTERAQFFRRMHGMTLACARAYLAQREERGFPLRGKMGQRWSAVVAPEVGVDAEVESGGMANFLLEIGVEELPPADLHLIKEQWKEYLEKISRHYGYKMYSEHKIYTTPRRLVLKLSLMSTDQLGLLTKHRGPPTKIAFDDAGNPTKAALGFARKMGVSLENLQVAEADGGEYVFAQVKRPVLEVFEERITELFNMLRFPRTMRWNEAGGEFSRPIRWLVALFGKQVIPFNAAGLTAGRETRGPRQTGSPRIELASADEYEASLQEHGIILDPAERRAEIQRQLAEEAATVGAQPPSDDELLDEVTQLVEVPTVFRGDFDARFLALPPVVLTTVMKKHQRYFALRDAEGALLPHFLAVRNGDEVNLAGVRRGNEQVLAARFADARFFYEEDRKQRLEDYLPRLATLTFHEKLGSMRAKSERLEKLVTPLADVLGFTPSEAETARQAARLCKADLATQLVIEMTALQGEIGRSYARADGEPAAVAEAIYEHWLPRFYGDVVPKSKSGILLALADNFDSLVGLFGAGIRASSTSDPYGLRRAALGIIRLLIEFEVDVSMVDLLEFAKQFQPLDDEVFSELRIKEFIGGRLSHFLEEEYPDCNKGFAIGSLSAVMTVYLALHRPLRAKCALDQLIPWTGKEHWPAILNGYARCARLTSSDSLVRYDYDPRPDLLIESAEQALYRGYLNARAKVDRDKSVDTLLSAVEEMLPAITRFFDEVLVMAEDERLKRNRLYLLNGIRRLADGIVDLSHMRGY